MDPLLSAAASGMRARMESLDMLANNLANADTTGYKTDREFYNLYLAAGADEAGSPWLPVIETQWTDHSQGLLRQTGNPLDLALSGKGFFVVDGPSGPLYTRSGSFHVSPAGQLLTQDGYAVRTSRGAGLQLAPAKAVRVQPDGAIEQEGQALGRLELADFREPALLRKQGHNYFWNPDPAVKAAAPASVDVQQGRLENSNVAAAESAVRLVSVMRQFEMLQRAVAMGGEMNRKAVEDVARVGQ